MNDRVTDLVAQLLKVVAASRCTSDAGVIEALLQILALTLSHDSADLHTINQRLRRLTREAAEHPAIVDRIFRNAGIVGGRE